MNITSAQYINNGDGDQLGIKATIDGTEMSSTPRPSQPPLRRNHASGSCWHLTIADAD